MQLAELESLLSLMLKKIKQYQDSTQWQWGIDIDNIADYRSIDQYVMTQAVAYPELHSLMRKIVNEIIKTNATGYILWDGDEEHLGSNAALGLALLNKKNVVLYSQFILTNDLLHPVYQEEDWAEVFGKWGCCPETLLLLITITLAPSQSFDIDDYWHQFVDYFSTHNINELFKQLDYFYRQGEKKKLFNSLILGSVEALLKQYLPLLSPHNFADKPNLTQLVATCFNNSEQSLTAKLDILIEEGVANELLDGCVLASKHIDGQIDDLTIIADFSLLEYRFAKGNTNDEQSIFYRHNALISLGAFIELYPNFKQQITSFFAHFIKANTVLFEYVNHCIYASYDNEPVASPLLCKTEKQKEEISEDNLLRLQNILNLYQQHSTNSALKSHIKILQTALSLRDQSFIKMIFIVNNQNCSLNYDLSFANYKYMLTITRELINFRIQEQNEQPDDITEPLPVQIYQVVSSIMGWPESGDITLSNDMSLSIGENKPLSLFVLQLVLNNCDNNKVSQFIHEKLLNDKSVFTHYYVGIIAGMVMISFYNPACPKNGGVLQFAHGLVAVSVKGKIIGSISMSAELTSLIKKIVSEGNS